MSTSSRSHLNSPPSIFNKHGTARLVSIPKMSDHNEEPEFLSIGPWHPPPQKRIPLPQTSDREPGKGAVTHVEVQVSRSPSLAEQPGLIPVEELAPVRFPSPFTGPPHEISAAYGHVRTANQHWQPLRTSPQLKPDSHSISQVDSFTIQVGHISSGFNVSVRSRIHTLAC